MAKQKAPQTAQNEEYRVTVLLERSQALRKEMDDILHDDQVREESKLRLKHAVKEWGGMIGE